MNLQNILHILSLEKNPEPAGIGATQISTDWPNNLSRHWPKRLETLFTYCR